MTPAEKLEMSRAAFFRAFAAARDKFQEDTGYIVTGVEVDHITHRTSGAIDMAVVTDFRIRVSAPRQCNPQGECGIIFEGSDDV